MLSLKTADGRLVLLILFYIFYLFFGAFMFDSLESPREAQLIGELNRYVKEFRARHDDCLTDDELNSFIRLISTANDKGVPAVHNVSREPNWSFGRAVFFAGTVLTTIGYGDVTVQTQLGKVFCIVFAIIGIPMTLLLLYSLIERFMMVTSYCLLAFTDLVHPKLRQVAALGQVQRSSMHVLFSLSCSLVVLVLFFVIPAAVYASIENWTYLDAFYYCFISLSTVGLGDYVPGDSLEHQGSHLYKIASTVYLLVGVMIMIWLTELFSQTPQFNFYKYVSLMKDGLLTSHRDVMHGQMATHGDSEFGIYGDASQLDDTNILEHSQSTTDAAGAEQAEINRG